MITKPNVESPVSVSGRIQAKMPTHFFTLRSCLSSLSLSLSLIKTENPESEERESLNPPKKSSMALRAAVTMAAPRGLGRLLSTSAFNFTPPPSSQPASPPAEPNPNVFVSGLSKRTTTEGLREAFSKFGEVVQAKVVTDRISGFSKGYGFVRYSTTEEARAGIQGMDGKFLDGWVIFAEFARPRMAPGTQQPYNSPPYNSGSQQ